MTTLIKTFLLVLEELFYFVFPLSEDEHVIKHLTPQLMQQKLRVRQYENTIVLTSFADPEMRALLHLVKFHRHPQALSLAASLFETWLTTHNYQSCVIIPIPLSDERKRQRGYNQVELIAQKAISSLSTHRIDTSILVRTRNTQPQSSLKRTERLKNMTGAFTVSRGSSLLHETHFILLDDVTTTGATLRAARMALQSLSPKSITCVALAH